MEKVKNQNHAEYEVEAILAERNTSTEKEYRVKWKNYDELSWEPERNLHCPDLFKAFKVSLHPRFTKVISL